VISLTEPIRNENGEIVSVMELAADVTEQKELEKNLNKTNQRLLTLFEEVPCYISIMDRNLKVVRANRRFREDFGEGVGDYCFKVYKHRTEPCLHCPVAATFNDGEVHQSEEVVQSNQGEPVNVLCYTTPIRDERGEITHVMEMSTNITPIRELQTQLESIGMLISSISHGIKGLLTGLDGGIYLVNSGLKKDNQKRLEQGWEMVQRNVGRIRDMVLNILYYAKERDPDWKVVSSMGLANEVLLIMEPKAEKLKIALKKDLHPDTSDIEVDPKALQSLLVNLMENSLDACRVDKKKEKHAVTLRVSGEEEYVRFEVEDNGIGMDRETREKAFTLFFSSKGVEGTGLGLFISNKIAHAHGGAIDLESEPDQGTRFVVRIPKRRVESKSKPVERTA
jgi:PAS domain S-box-containing protein